MVPVHPFLQHQPVAEVHAVDSLVDAQHHASHRLSVRGFARLAVSAYSKTKPLFQPNGQGTHRSQRSLAHCMRPAISHAAGWNRTTAGLGFRNDRGRMGGISRPASSRPPRSRRSRSRSLLMQRGIGDGDADHGVSEQLVVPVVEAAALAPCGELGFGHAWYSERFCSAVRVSACAPSSPLSTLWPPWVSTPQRRS